MWYFRVTRSSAIIFWLGYAGGLLTAILYVNSGFIYGHGDGEQFSRFYNQNSADNKMYLTARMVKSLADQAMVGKKSLILIAGDSKLRGHGTASVNSFSAQLSAHIPVDGSVAVLNLSRDGLGGITPYLLHEFILNYYPQTYLITNMQTLPPMPKISRIHSSEAQSGLSMESSFIWFDIWSYSVGRVATSIFVAEADQDDFLSYRILSVANYVLGFIDYGQNFRYSVMQTVYTDAVKYHEIGILKSIRSTTDRGKDSYWHLDNPNYTEKNIDAEERYWKNNYALRSLDTARFDSDMSSILPAQWARTYLIAEVPVPYMRERAGLNSGDFVKSQTQFVTYYTKKNAAVVLERNELTQNTDYSDMVHWSKNGAAKMAEVFWNKLYLRLSR